MATEYISTETGCQYLRKYKIEDGTSFPYDVGFNDGIEMAISCIGNEVPAADVVEVRHGRWEYEQFTVMYGNPYGCYRCSACGDASPHISNYCPNCGADMRERNK